MERVGGDFKDMDYYAHSENKLGQKHLLSKHLLKTAEIAESFVNSDVTKRIFRIAGLLHDLGKYQPEFQRYLAEGGRRGSVPHAVWGAGYARIHRMNEIAFVVDGHHKGLPNKSDLTMSTEEFKRKEVALFDSVVSNFLKDVSITESELNIQSPLFQNLLQKELFTRYIFSALTDADWLDTEAHFDPNRAQGRKSQILVIDELIKKLKKALPKPDGREINRLRNQARENVLQKAGKSVGFYSLCLPTGLGKTLISVSWALHHARANGLKRILIVLPYINIIDQTARILKDIFGEELVLEHHSNYNENAATLQNDECNLDPIQKGKRLASENWDYPIIVTTTVQFFESFFSNKPSKCRKIHNIAESVVIFDEVQSLPKEIILPSLSMLKNIQTVMRTSFLFCTATQPAFQKRDKFDGIETIYPLIDNPAEIFEKTRRTDYHLLQDLNPVSQNILFEAVKENNYSVLIIFNTKKATLEFYGQAAKSPEPWEKKYHLSTAMCPHHRKQVIDAIRDDLEKRCKILVSSTQLIEAGVDFDFPCVFREMAPLESIIQSAGRCNREGRLTERGKVYLFRLEGSGMPDKTYKACAGYAKDLIQDDINRLYRHDFFEEYYSQVVGLFVDPDKNNILPAQENFDFETVNDSYRLIQDATEGLFIYNYSDDSRKLFDSIKHKEFLSRDDYRKMQVFTVQVYQQFLFQNPKSYEIRPQGFLVWYGNYDQNTGISAEPMAADKSIV